MISDVFVLKMKTNPLSLPGVISLIERWVVEGAGRYICLSNVHMCMEVDSNIGYRSIVNNADLVLADGKPIYWMQKILSDKKEASHLRGADVTRAILNYCNNNDVPVGFFGCSEKTLNEVSAKLKERYTSLKISYLESPPFCDLSEYDLNQYIEDIQKTSPKILFVALGCPKQERFMFEISGRYTGVMVGIGAAVDFLSGKKPEAPSILIALGLEWMYRLFSEPGRLWKRYLYTNTRFIILSTFFLVKRYFGFLK